MTDYLQITTTFARKVRAALLTPCVNFLFFLIITLVIFIGIVPRLSIYLHHLVNGIA